MVIQITEHKSASVNHINDRNMVRVYFKGSSNDYGWFIPEQMVFDTLGEHQQANYTTQDEFDIADEDVPKLQEAGLTWPPAK